MNTIDRAHVVSRLQQLPSLPDVVAELLASLGNEDIDFQHLAQQISRDQGLTARVLRVANSSFYGLQSKIGTIHEAVVVLGFRAVRSMVLAVSMGGAFRADVCHGFDQPGYVRSSVACGMVARTLALRAGRNPDLAFTAGILHDLGQLVLAASFPAQYAQALAYRKAQNVFLLTAERDVLGVDHAEAGALLAETWKFPPLLAAALSEHHAPAAATAESLADLIHVADAVVRALGLEHANDPLVMPVDPVAWQRLGVQTSGLGEVFGEVLGGLDETCQAFGR